MSTGRPSAAGGRLGRRLTGGSHSLARVTDHLRRTALHAEHAAAGARLVPFAGWEMPVEYGSIREEHAAVREHAGMFDVSHMGQVATHGPQARDLLQHLLSNDVDRVQLGGAQYSVLCREDGGVLDDLFTYRLADEQWLTVTNAANHEQDHAWIASHADGRDVVVEDVADRYAMIAVQGPEAREIVAAITEGELPGRFRAAELTVNGGPALVCGTGYTGEDGVEILCPPENAADLWRALAAGGVRPVGLAARDTLRLEVCFHLYGNDLMPTRGPIEAGLGWAVKEDTGFLGSDAVRRVREAGPSERLVAFRIEGRGIPRQGNPVLLDGEPVGEVTSGTMSPSLGVGCGMAYVRSEHAVPGTAVQVDVRGRVRDARIVEKPLYRRED